MSEKRETVIFVVGMGLGCIASAITVLMVLAIRDGGLTWETPLALAIAGVGWIVAAVKGWLP